jgi:hypothetical protein
MERIIERQNDRGSDGRFQAGNAGRPSKAEIRARIQQEAETLAADLVAGGFNRLGAADQRLLLKAADLLLRRPHDHSDLVRGVNSADRILRGIAKRHGGRRRPRIVTNWLEAGRR